MTEKTHVFTCDRCKQTITHVSDFTTGYGVNDQGQKACYACCGEIDQDFMLETGKITLYLTGENDTLSYNRSSHFIPKKVSNWPGSLEFEVLSWSLGDHNWGIPRYDVWFKGPDGRVWYGVHMGYHSQLIHCKRTKHTGYAGIVADYHGLTLSKKGE